MQQSPVILDLCGKKKLPGKSRNYREAIGFEKLRLQIEFYFRPHENEKLAFSSFSGLESVFEKFRFRDGSVWTEPHRKPRLMQALAGKQNARSGFLRANIRSAGHVGIPASRHISCCIQIKERDVANKHKSLVFEEQLF